MDGIEYLRYILLFVTILTTSTFIALSIIAWRKLSLSQKLFAVGTICYMLAGMILLREVIEVNYPFRGRTFLLIFGQFFYIAYLLEPMRSHSKRFGKPNPVFRDKE